MFSKITSFKPTQLKTLGESTNITKVRSSNYFEKCHEQKFNSFYKIQIKTSPLLFNSFYKTQPIIQGFPVLFKKSPILFRQSPINYLNFASKRDYSPVPVTQETKTIITQETKSSQESKLLIQDVIHNHPAIRYLSCVTGTIIFSTLLSSIPLIYDHYCLPAFVGPFLLCITCGFGIVASLISLFDYENFNITEYWNEVLMLFLVFVAILLWSLTKEKRCRLLKNVIEKLPK